MYVVPEIRGHGLGRLILRNLEYDALAVAMQHMLLEIGRDNQSALRLSAAWWPWTSPPQTKQPHAR
jgi:hypothetical protein